mgnify:CR=1 FL=1
MRLLRPCLRRSRRFGMGMLLALVPGIAGPGTGAAELDIKTEEYPPAYFTGPDGAIRGIVTETVRAMAASAGIRIDLEMLPFKRGYRHVRRTPGSCFMALWRTPARAPAFAWVGPLLADGFAIYTRAGSDIRIETIRDSFAYRVGAVAGWGSTQTLKQLGHPRLVVVTRDALNLRMLQAGRIDAWLTGIISGPYKAARNGLDIERQVVVRELGLWLACHPQTDPASLAALRGALMRMRDAGTIEALRHKYLRRHGPG